jgi:hypothetical protein
MMSKRWHQFHDAQTPPYFGFGTEAQASRWLSLRNGQRIANHFTLTALDEGKEPPDGALVIDLDTGELQSERYGRNVEG